MIKIMIINQIIITKETMKINTKTMTMIKKSANTEKEGKYLLTSDKDNKPS